METKTNYIFEASALAEIGISVIPVKKDGSKLPGIKWKEFQQRIMNQDEINHHFADCGGVIAITGAISNLLCIDFDLDKQLPTDDFWGEFCKDIPDELKERMLINNTRSGGYHMWIRTDYEDKSRKIAHRPLTIPEIHTRYLSMIEQGANEVVASRMILNKPVECVIETRSKGSYGVFVHEQYSRFYGDSIGWFSKDEVEQILLNQAYSLDCDYRKPKPFRGKVEDYKVLCKFNEDVTPADIVEILEQSGLFRLYDVDSNGNFRMSRVGSSSPFSAFIFKTSGVFHVFGMSPFSEGDKTTFSPFEVFCAVNDLDESGGIEKLRNQL